MAHLIDKSALVAEIERQVKLNETCQKISGGNEFYRGAIDEAKEILSFLNTLEVKEADLNNSIQLTWEDMRELYIIFVEVDTEIELCKTDIKMETLGYYQEVLKRFKAQKGE